jgi:hypothetical protein
VATKKKVIVEIKEDTGKKARREARVIVGIVKPGRVVEERQSERRKPKHKRDLTSED